MQAKNFGKRASVDVRCADASSRAYLDADSTKNACGSHYHVREPATQHLNLTFKDFAECLASWKAKKLLVRVRSCCFTTNIIMQNSHHGNI